MNECVRCPYKFDRIGGSILHCSTVSGVGGSPEDLSREPCHSRNTASSDFLSPCFQILLNLLHYNISGVIADATAEIVIFFHNLLTVCKIAAFRFCKS